MAGVAHVPFVAALAGVKPSMPVNTERVPEPVCGQNRMMAPVEPPSVCPCGVTGGAVVDAPELRQCEGRRRAGHGPAGVGPDHRRHAVEGVGVVVEVCADCAGLRGRRGTADCHATLLVGRQALLGVQELLPGGRAVGAALLSCHCHLCRRQAACAQCGCGRHLRVGCQAERQQVVDRRREQGVHQLVGRERPDRRHLHVAGPGWGGPESEGTATGHQDGRGERSTPEPPECSIHSVFSVPHRDFDACIAK